MKRRAIWLGGAFVVLALLLTGGLYLFRAGPAQSGAPDSRSKPSAPIPDDYEPTYKEPPTVRRMSMVELLANPKEYDGTRVATIGYLTLEHEGEAVYLHREDYEHHLTTNGVRLKLTAEQARTFQKTFHRSCYAVVEGDFHAPKDRQRIPYGGSIGHVVLLEPQLHYSTGDVTNDCE